MDNSLCFMGLWFLLVGVTAANIGIIFDLAKKMFFFRGNGQKNNVHYAKKGQFLRVGKWLIISI